MEESRYTKILHEYALTLICIKKNNNMKKTSRYHGKPSVIRIITLVCFLGLAISMNAKGGEKKKKADALLHIEAKIELDKDISDSNTKVELFCHAELIDSKVPAKDGSFEFDLKKDQYYSIRITKSGYVPKIIGIDTEVPVDLKDQKEFVFSTGLLSENEAAKLDKNVLEFPAALIMYYDKTASFEFCLEYATVRKAMLSTSSENTAGK